MINQHHHQELPHIVLDIQNLVSCNLAMLCNQDANIIQDFLLKLARILNEESFLRVLPNQEE